MISVWDQKSPVLKLFIHVRETARRTKYWKPYKQEQTKKTQVNDKRAASNKEQD